MSLSTTVSRSTATGLQLTRRGRFVFVGLPVMITALAVAVAAFLFMVPGAAHAETELAGQVTETVTVGQGESLWHIAAEISPDSDPREMMTQLERLNNLSSHRLVPGQTLVVPALSDR